MADANFNGDLPGWIKTVIALAYLNPEDPVLQHFVGQLNPQELNQISNVSDELSKVKRSLCSDLINQLAARMFSQPLPDQDPRRAFLASLPYQQLLDLNSSNPQPQNLEELQQLLTALVDEMQRLPSDDPLATLFQSFEMASLGSEELISGMIEQQEDPTQQLVDQWTTGDLVLVHSELATFNNRWTPTELIDNRVVRFGNVKPPDPNLSNVKRIKIYGFHSEPLYELLRYLAEYTNVLELQIDTLVLVGGRMYDYSFRSLQTLSIDSIEMNGQVSAASCTLNAPKLNALLLGE